MTEPESAIGVAGRRVRRWRGIVLFVLAMVLLAVVLAVLKPAANGGYLDPDSAADDGSRALVEILRQHGTPVTVARSASAAVSSAEPDAVIVVVRTERLTAEDLDRLAAAPGELVLIEPSRETLRKLAPGVFEATVATGTVEPACAFAEAAGAVGFGAAHVYTAPADATTCYPSVDDKAASRLVRTSGARPVTVLGSGTPFTNAELAKEGNAALGMNLAGARTRAIWLMPELPAEGSTGDKSFFDLVPHGVSLFFWQVLIAVALLAFWRARRLGPVVVERLPVAVRSAETVEGRARLYRAVRARDRAALALRESARERLVPLLGLPRSAAGDPGRAQEIVNSVLLRTGGDQQTTWWALYGPEPADDAELVRLTDLLDDLEKRLR